MSRKWKSSVSWVVLNEVRKVPQKVSLDVWMAPSQQCDPHWLQILTRLSNDDRSRECRPNTKKQNLKSHWILRFIVPLLKEREISISRTHLSMTSQYLRQIKIPAQQCFSTFLPPIFHMLISLIFYRKIKKFRQTFSVCHMFVRIAIFCLARSRCS